VLIRHFRALLLASILAGAPAFAQTTVTLMEGLNGYGGTTDARIVAGSPTTNAGAATTYFLRQESHSSVVVRFAIFAADGGPVPDNATITSATLSLYKYWGAAATIKASRLKRAWNESQVTWNQAASGTAWQTAGAMGANDVEAAADGQALVGDGAANDCLNGAAAPAACWLNIDVTSGVQAFRSGTPNHGWKLAYVSGGDAGDDKEFNASEVTGWPALRPKLTVTYTVSSCDSGALRPYDAAPISGTPIAIAAGGTTTFEAEHFNCGGQNVAYNDLTVGSNAGQTFRAAESVDLVDAPGGLAVNQFDGAEWLTYSISVAASGTYDIGILASASASGGGPGAFRIEIDGTDVTGVVTVPLTDGWQDYQWVNKAGVALQAGQHVLKLVSVGTYFRTDKLRLVASAPPASCDTGASRPFDGSPVNGTAIPVPGSGATFEAEHFNCGGEGQGYHETTAGNNAGQTFRAGESVEAIAAPGGLAVNQFAVGEWMTYSLNVAAAGTYDLAILASASASGGGPGAFRIEIDGVDVTGNVTVPLTSGWEDYQWVTKTGVSLAAGQRQLKLISVTQSYRIDKLRITPGGVVAGDCAAGTNLCVRFEAAPETQFEGIDFAASGQGEVRVQSLGATIGLPVHNQGNGACNGDRADDTSRITLVNGGRDGSKALKVTTQHLDNCVHGTLGGSLEDSWERSEVLLRAEDTAAAPGVEQWWAHSVFFPAEFQVDGPAYSAALFLQFKAVTEGQPIFALDVFREPAAGGTRSILHAVTRGAGGVDENAQYGYLTSSGAEMKGACLDTDFQEGVWYDFVHHIRWSYTGTGSHEIWMRKAGSPVKKVLHKTGINTMYGNAGAYLKFGMYHSAVSGVSSVIHDRLRRGNSFAAVAMADFTMPSTVDNCTP
jgi:hypothetical protein